VTVTIRYFALFREQTGKDQETLELSAATPAAAYQEVSHRYGFSLPLDRVRFAVNGQYQPADSALPAACTLALIPPLAGG
jgi:molybdopterin converting factor small subunit